MNWKQEAIDKLRCYAARKHALVSLPRQIEETKLRRESVRGARIDGKAGRICSWGAWCTRRSWSGGSG